MHTEDVLDTLQKFDYTREITRTRGLFHVLFMTLAIFAVPYSLAAPIATSLAAGGPAVILWGWILVSALTQTLALSLAEICSKYPTSGGAYYWCYYLAPPRYKLVLSWINGWLNLVGNWIVTLSVTFGTAELIVAGVGIPCPDWIAAPWQTYTIFLGVTIVSCGSCLFLNDYLPTVDIACACWTTLGIIVNLICLLWKAAAGRRSASFALGEFSPASGWNPGWSFFIGLLPVAYTYVGIGMVASMAEEVHNPSETLPKAISLSVPIGTIWGIFFLLPILFTLPDVNMLLQVGTGQPIGVMFTLIMGSKTGGFWLWFIVFGMALFCAISISCAASRTTWVFARDKAIPCHAYFSQISTRLQDVPVNALLLSTAIQVILGLVYLGSSTAFNAFIGVAVMCLGASYALPVAILLAQGRRGVADAPFQLGRAGAVINATAVLWIAFAIILFSMPANVPVTQGTMNYASVVLVAFAVISGAWYWLNGRFHYTGPPVPSSDSPSELSLSEGVSKAG